VLLRGPNFLEDLAILVYAGAISFEIVRKSLGSGIEDEWNHWSQRFAGFEETRSTISS
jgi:hypothetical protein